PTYPLSLHDALPISSLLAVCGQDVLPVAHELRVNPQPLLRQSLRARHKSLRLRMPSLSRTPEPFDSLPRIGSTMWVYAVEVFVGDIVLDCARRVTSTFGAPRPH